jgi:hypothetical protein
LQENGRRFSVEKVFLLAYMFVPYVLCRWCRDEKTKPLTEVIPRLGPRGPKSKVARSAPKEKEKQSSVNQQLQQGSAKPQKRQAEGVLQNRGAKKGKGEQRLSQELDDGAAAVELEGDLQVDLSDAEDGLDPEHSMGIEPGLVEGSSSSSGDDSDLGENSDGGDNSGDDSEEQSDQSYDRKQLAAGEMRVR